MITADDFSFQTSWVPAQTGSGRHYTSTLAGPHGTAEGTGDTGAAAVTAAAAAYESLYLGSGMVPAAG